MNLSNNFFRTDLTIVITSSLLSLHFVHEVSSLLYHIKPEISPD